MDYLLDEQPLSAGVIYRLLSGSVCPRPIAWVSTQDKDGNTNLAPFSFFNVASVNPPILAFSPLLDGSGRPKDTLRNLTELAECVVHIGNETLIEALNTTSASVPPEQDEFLLAGLEKAEMPGISVPRIAGAPVAFGCKLRDLIRFGDQPLAGSLVLAEIVAMHIDDAIWDGRHINMDMLKPVGRLAGSDYVRISDRFALERPA
ncbi:flavin reductase family protein [Vreelandella venusta]|uniref:Flavin reductase family protein n=1 Tax=Vreelandella venusta TaxID=44935 RepID=A0AAP9ZBG5_9GAMM|nr:flavin reductase family protein [Halomonas venusta]AZM96857.1 flavin reductase family protein [Halomonas venusta]MDW0360355.1 flavin reductase family protein [Halomonas venusta]MDX1356731.1 flavin reductase family protein [Halomonas venusta]NPT32264.1 flavin reductase family protein [Halomonas venusta]QRL02324.1 flavin reductase family protein [Halomonas venusta]